MGLWRYAQGIAEVELTSADPEGLLDMIRISGAEIRNIQKVSDLSVCFQINRKDTHAVTLLCRKQGGILKMRKQKGIYWTGKRILSRPVLVIGGIFLLTLVLWTPSRILFVRVEGNDNVPSRQILEAAEGCGIGFGVSRREVRSEKMKNELLAALPQLRWAGVNTDGCTAVISVRERNESAEAKDDRTVASLAASRDGFIVSCTAQRGNLLVKPGDTVKEGQILISSYTDCGLCIRAERAEGEIYAQTNRTMDVYCPSEYGKKVDSGVIKRKISILIRKKRIILWKDSGICGGSCGRMYEEYYVTLPGGFRLPVAVCVEEFRPYRILSQELSETEAGEMLDVFAKQYLTGEMISGKILQYDRQISFLDGLYRLRGEYVCTEMICRRRQEQIGDTNGKNS